jgi:4-hydroxy-tetrahydrodipicolinate reductase
MKRIEICLCGARGRMGRRLAELIQQSEDLELTSAVERPAHPELGLEIAAGVELTADSARAAAAAAVILDFSSAQAVAEHLRLARSLKKPYVTGVTGLSPEVRHDLEEAARHIPVLYSSNMSRGVWLLGRLLEMAAEGFPRSDVEIFELHHAGKADAPSGTALMLAELVQKARGGEKIYGRQARRQPGEIGLAAARGGDVVGEHQVYLLAPGEQIILTHRATSRDHFCQGALEAVRFVASAPSGLYGMDDVFGRKVPEEER